MSGTSVTPIFQQSVTSRGLRVLTESHAGSRGVSAHLWVEVGTRDESLQNVGVSHLIEHMVFKGTQGMSVLDIAKSLESVGGDLNAYTSREFTCYHTLSLKKDLELSLKVLGELTTKPLFRGEDLLKEKQVILQEMDMTKDLLEEAIFDDFFTWVYPKNSAGWPIFGTPESVVSISETELRDFFGSWYHAGNMILTVVGDVEHSEVLDLAEKHFASIAPAGLSAERRCPDYADFKVFCPRPSEQTHFIIGLPSSSYRDDFRFEAYVVNTLLGGGMTSKLYQRIREDLGLAYTIGSTLHSYKDCGLMLIAGAAHPDSISQIVDEVHQTLSTLYKEGLTEADLEMFKNQIKGQILLGADDLENRASSLGINQMVYGRYRSVDEVIANIDQVSLESVRAFLKSQDESLWSLYLLGAGKNFELLGGAASPKVIRESSNTLS